MVPLPIDPQLPQIVQSLRTARSLVLVAPPGAGKTTRVPPAIYRAGLLGEDHPNLIMLQPRRVAARASAMRIAEENYWTVGGVVGYQVRFERRISQGTRIHVMTEGILTRRLVDDPFLEGVGAVLLDEFHERSIHTDLAIALLREIQQTVRPDLMLLVMSATLEAQPVAHFLGDCPIVETKGRTYAVEIEHRASEGLSSARLPERVLEAMTILLSEEGVSGLGSRVSGPPETRNPTPDPRASRDVLIFLPGVGEIRRTMHRIEPLAEQHDLLLLPLHGSLGADDQMLALRPADRRKVVLATNIAETSLTIDGVTTVIDTGLAREAGYDARRGLDRLVLRRISKASATQRAGRAGRTAPGRAIRLWSAKEHAALDDFDLPEIQRVDLAPTVLALHAWGKPDPRAFGWYQAPPEETLAAAERLLAMLGALDAETNGQITDLGRRMLAIPAHPRIARLLLSAAEWGMLDEGAAIAALLSEKDIAIEQEGPAHLRTPRTQGDSDLLWRLDLLHEAEKARFAAHLRDSGIDPHAARQVARTRDELLRISRRLDSGLGFRVSGFGGEVGSRQYAVGRRDQSKIESRKSRILSPNPQTGIRNPRSLLLPLLAYPDRVVRRREADPSTGVMVGGGGVKLSAESIVRQGELFLALDARHDERSPTRQALVRIASRIEPQWLEELFPQSIRRERSVVFDDQRQRVVGLGQTFYRDLLLKEDRDAPVDRDQAADVLAGVLARRAPELFAADESASLLLARVALLRSKMPEHPWPAFTDDELREILRPIARGKKSIDDLRRVGLAGLLRAHLQYPLDRLVDQEAPEAIEVPSGSRIRLRYENTGPALAVRLQELFGLPDTPRIAAGRVKVKLELLGPNFRPVQITDDLASFWKNTYPQVRKDLRARYPRHSWPDDPLTAPPQAKGGRRR